MSVRQVVAGPGGRNILREKGEPDKVALPMHFVDGACTDEEKILLFRWIDASEMAKGNMSVIVIDGEPRGRYAEYADRIDPETYRKFEVAAYLWIKSTDFSKENHLLAEIFARMSGERTDVDFQAWGRHISGSDNPDIALGASIGTTRALAWSLKKAYARYYDYELMQRKRRSAVTASYANYRPQIIDGKTES